MIKLLLASVLWAAPKTDLSVALNAEFETLNPVVNSMVAAYYVYDVSMRPLVALPPEGGKPYAVLLKELPTIENKQVEFIDRGLDKPRGLKVKLEILPAAQWGDGKPLTCEDLKLTWSIGKHPNVSTPARAEYSNIEDIRIDAANPKKCEMIFTEAKADFTCPCRGRCRRTWKAKSSRSTRASLRPTSGIRCTCAISVIRVCTTDRTA